MRNLPVKNTHDWPPSHLTAFTVGASASRIVSSSSTRRRLVFYPPPTGSYTVSPDTPTANGVGICLVSGAAPVVLDLWEDGSVVQQEWQGFASAGGILGSFLEVFHPDN